MAYCRGEVAGDAAFLIPKQPKDKTDVENWAVNAAKTVEKIISLSPAERKTITDKGIENAKRFNTGHALDQIEKIYQSII